MEEQESTQDLRRVEFATAMRGYEKEEVDTFLRELAGEQDRLTAELARAKRAAEKAHLELGEEIGQLLQHAKDVADGLVKKAEEEAASIQEKARRTADKTTTDAEAKADALRRASEADAVARVRDAQEKVRALQDTEGQVRTRLYSLRQTVATLNDTIEEAEARPPLHQDVLDDTSEVEALTASVTPAPVRSEPVSPEPVQTGLDANEA